MDSDNLLARRAVLKSAAGITGIAALGGGSVLAAAPPPPSSTAPSPRQWLDITAFGAKGDGTTAADAPIAAALQAAQKTAGGIVWFPPGKYLLNSRLVVEKQVTLLGAGWSSRDTSCGSWIIVKREGVNVQLRGQGTVLRGIGFHQEQPPPTTPDWQPRKYDFALHAANDDIFIEQVNLLNCTNGISIRHHDGGNIGRVILDHIFGRPLRRGIEIDNARDVVKINNVHFWPFWQETSPVVGKWMSQNGQGITLFRADNPMFSNIFLSGYNRGFAFHKSGGGITTKFALLNADCDYCETAIHIDGPGTSGAITNLNAQGAPGDVGIFISGDDVNLLASNVRLTNYRGNAIRVAGKNSRMPIQNLWIQGWNHSKKGFPAVEASDGTTVFLGRPAMFESGFGAPACRRDGANGGRVLTEFSELISENA